ncbi:T9SS type A sorting domain-containing protein [Pontibacter silvestris]|uniref:T9SS type A sorting domain-containing protein n=1 Tax=Pontibacter silvestris TaxID=2305183 RepID=A0ABW4X2T3_9BACT|nr:T9SS type A sorting domain-containing protein [Pontibacter silvestris]MCC9135807.1 T9SS type A sorting domain-containing protein [Pontibacter silvestris]
MTSRYTLRSLSVRLYLLLALLVFGLTAFADAGNHMVPISLEDRIKNAEIVLEGEVVSKNSFWDARHENIYTSNIIKVYKLFKGNLPAAEVEIITEGGSIGLKMHVFSSALQLREGQQGVFFLNKQEEELRKVLTNASVVAKAYGNKQGFVRYNLEQNTAADVFNSFSSIQEVHNAIAKSTGSSYRTITENKRLSTLALKQDKEQNALLAVNITSFSPTEASAGTNTVLTINGTDFGSSRGNGYVEFRNADDGGETFVRPLDSDYVSWNSTQIQVRIPSIGIDGGTAGTGEVRVTTSGGTTVSSATLLTIPFAYSNISPDGISYQPILVGTNSRGGYMIQLAPNLQSNTPAQEGFTRAMNNWICSTNVNWELGSSTTISKSADDNTNVIMFAPGSVVGEGVLASTISRYSGCQSSSTGEIAWGVEEFDMQINSNISWQYGPDAPSLSQYDFETVVLHELGHAHQLGHVILANEAVMHYAVERRRSYRDLSEADIEGADLVISNSFDPATVALATSCTDDDGRSFGPLVLRTDCNLSPSEVVAYPNPINSATGNVIQLEYITSANTVMTFHLYNSLGKLLYKSSALFSRTNSLTELSLDGLAAGLYILRWEESDNSGSVKIIKQ